MYKPIKLGLLTLIIRCVFSEDGKFYPQLFLDGALYELVWKFYNTKELIVYITSEFNFMKKTKTLLI